MWEAGSALKSDYQSPIGSYLSVRIMYIMLNRESGWSCFDFGLAYGEVAEGLIHVHHIVPLSTIGAEYKLDPIKDLIPLCPNCHAVVHRGSEVMSIAKLKEHLAEAKRRSTPGA